MQTDKTRVKAAIESFPATFGLHGFPGKTFRIATEYCYVNDSGDVQVVTEVQDGDKWLHFTRSSVDELAGQVR